MSGQVDLDWSKAPEGAILFHNGVNSGHFPHWVDGDGRFSFKLGNISSDWTSPMHENYPIDGIKYHERPAKKVEKFVPKVGDRCIAYEYSTQQNRESVYIGDDPRSESSTWKAFSSITTGQPFFSDRYEFHSLNDEREKFIESNCSDLYLNAINSSRLISMPQSTGEDLASIILGYIYDKGARFND